MKHTADHHNAILDPDTLLAVDTQSANTLATVHRHQADTRGKIRKFFDVTRSSVVQGLGFVSEEQQLQNDAKNRIKEKKLTGKAADAELAEAQRLTTHDEEITAYKPEVHVAGKKATVSLDASKLEASVKGLVFPSPPPSWLGKQAEFSLAKLTYNQVQELAKDPTVLATVTAATAFADLKTKLGIELDSSSIIAVPPTTDELKKIILYALIQESTLATSLGGEAGGVVSQANVHRAMDMACKNPDLLKELSSHGHSESVKKLDAQKNMLGNLLWIKNLATTSHIDLQYSYTKLPDQINNIREDMNYIETHRTGTAAWTPFTSGFPKCDLLNKPGITFHRNADRAIDQLYAYEESLEKQMQYAEKIKWHLQAVEDFADDAEIKTGLTGSGAHFGSTPKKVDEIPAGFNPISQVDKWISAWKLKATPAEYDTAIHHAEEEAKAAKEGKGQKVGKEAVLAIYKKYYEKYHVPPLSGQKAEQAAIALFVKQSVTKEEREHTDEVVDEMLGDKNGVLDAAVKNTKELFNGSEHDMVINLAKSLKIKTNAWKMGSIEIGARVLQSEQKLRPKWQAATYEQQLTAFWSLRKLVENGALTNSTFVRAQMKELAHLIQGEWYLRLHLATEQLEKKDKATALTEDQQKSIEASKNLAVRRTLFSDFLAADLDAVPAYKPKVEQAVSKALEKTGKWRRKILGAGLATGKKGVEFTGKTLNVGKNAVTGTVGGISRWTIGKIKWAFTPGGGGAADHGGGGGHH